MHAKGGAPETCDLGNYVGTAVLSPPARLLAQDSFNLHVQTSHDFDLKFNTHIECRISIVQPGTSMVFFEAEFVCADCGSAYPPE